jgi:hypothetical protein
VLGAGETIDGADFTIDDDGQHLGWSRDGLHELHGGCGLDARNDPVFQLFDVVVEGIKDLQLLLDAASCLLRQLLKGAFQLWSPLGCKDIAGGVE